ncbi:hypothetical protein AcV5_001647 [Taiwanofungus camphoratus]|nr:hypothetical protein AcV5_001647 [Antrodia cinnamomea]
MWLMARNGDFSSTGLQDPYKFALQRQREFAPDLNCSRVESKSDLMLKQEGGSQDQIVVQ